MTTGFFCHACLEDKLAPEVSPDSRYCQGCYDFLLKEAEMDSRRGVGDWKPIKPYNKAEIGGEKTAQVSNPMRTIKSTLEGEKSKVDIIQPRVASGATKKRGRKFKHLPEDFIKQLADKGMGSKAIATQLKREHGIDVSYKTIQRVLSGERK